MMILIDIKFYTALVKRRLMIILNLQYINKNMTRLSIHFNMNSYHFTDNPLSFIPFYPNINCELVYRLIIEYIQNFLIQ